MFTYLLVLLVGSFAFRNAYTQDSVQLEPQVSGTETSLQNPYQEPNPENPTDGKEAEYEEISGNDIDNEYKDGNFQDDRIRIMLQPKKFVALNITTLNTWKADEETSRKSISPQPSGASRRAMVQILEKENPLITNELLVVSATAVPEGKIAEVKTMVKKSSTGKAQAKVFSIKETNEITSETSQVNEISENTSAFAVAHQNGKKILIESPNVSNNNKAQVNGLGFVNFPANFVDSFMSPNKTFAKPLEILGSLKNISELSNNPESGQYASVTIKKDPVKSNLLQKDDEKSNQTQVDTPTENQDEKLDHTQVDTPTENQDEKLDQTQVDTPTENQDEKQNQTQVDTPTENQDEKLDQTQVDTPTENQDEKSNQTQIDTPAKNQDEKQNQTQIDSPTENQDEKLNQTQIDSPTENQDEKLNQTQIDTPTENQDEKSNQTQIDTPAKNQDEKQNQTQIDSPTENQDEKSNQTQVVTANEKDDEKLNHTQTDTLKQNEYEKSNKTQVVIPKQNPDEKLNSTQGKSPKQNNQKINPDTQKSIGKPNNYNKPPAVVGMEKGVNGIDMKLVKTKEETEFDDSSEEEPCNGTSSDDVLYEELEPDPIFEDDIEYLSPQRVNGTKSGAIIIILPDNGLDLMDMNVSQTNVVPQNMFSSDVMAKSIFNLLVNLTAINAINERNGRKILEELRTQKINVHHLRKQSDAIYHYITKTKSN